MLSFFSKHYLTAFPILIKYITQIAISIYEDISVLDRGELK